MSLDYIKEKISPILKKNDILYAGVFGSTSRGNNRPDSDVDILVKLGKPMGIFSFMNMEIDMENALGKKVDLVTDNSLKDSLKPFVLKDLITIYER